MLMSVAFACEFLATVQKDGAAVQLQGPVRNM